MAELARHGRDVVFGKEVVWLHVGHLVFSLHICRV